MSHTRRRDPIDTAARTPDFVIMGETVAMAPTAKERRLAHQDGKKRHKPGRAAKSYLSKGAKAKTRRTLAAVVEDPEAAPMPRAVRSHVWDYN